MNKHRFDELLLLFLLPLAMAASGLALIIWPDTALTIIITVLSLLLRWGGGLIFIGSIFFGGSDRPRLMGWSALAVGIGLFFKAFPLLLAKIIGRCLGVFLIILGIFNIRKALQRKALWESWVLLMIGAVLALAAGLFLLLTPLALNRILMRICGAALLAIDLLYILFVWMEAYGQDDDFSDF